MTQLVLVHGRAQEFTDPVALKAEWIESLRVGLAKSGLELPIAETDVRLPYYGQTLYDLIGTQGPVADVIVKGTPTSNEEQAFARSVIEEARSEIGISASEVAAEAGAEVVAKGPQNWGWVQATLRLIDERVPGSGIVLRFVTYDVYQYLGNPGIRDTIEAGVRNAILPRVPTVVVGHSLGSVVAYSLINREGDALGWAVPLFVTVGSPLAVTAIKKRLAPIKHPQCVRSWFNARDKKDVVALYPLDKSHFAVRPEIENKNDLENLTGNRHGIVGYLGDLAVARKIYDALTEAN